MINVGGRLDVSQGGAMKRRDLLKRMLDRYHIDPRQFSNEQKESLAKMAYMEGLDFEVKSKPLKKGVFDLADMALLGMIPNKWRPRSIGQEYHGETSADKFAGGLGTAAGLVPAFFTGGLALQGVRGLARGGAGLAGKAKKGFDAYSSGQYAGMGGSGRIGAAASRVKEAAARARADLIARYKQGYNSVPLGPMPLSRQIPEFASGSTGRQMNLFNLID